MTEAAAAPWFPLCVRTTYSQTRGLSRIDAISAHLQGNHFAGCGVADYGNLAAVPTFVRELKKAKLCPIAGLCLQVAVSDSPGAPCHRLFLYARDQSAWKRLCEIATESNNPARHNGQPWLPFDMLRDQSDGIIAISGQSWTTLAAAVFERPAQAYLAPSTDDAKTCLRADWTTHLLDAIDRHRSVFGQNLYLGTQLMDAEVFPASRLLAEAMRWAAKRTGLRCVAIADAHYLRPDDAADHRVMLCAELGSTMTDAPSALSRHPDASLSTFFKCSRYYLPTQEEMRALHPENELACATEIASSCEAPVTEGPPLMPDFRPPDGSSCDDHFKALCRAGWRKKLDPMLGALGARERQEARKRYGDRAKEEIEVLCQAGLAPQFLVVEDYVRFARSFSMAGTGRGSVGGCLVAYLLDISRADPLRYGLLFERFFNAGKVVAGKLTSLADIDMDFEPSARERIFAYLQDKYGHDRVCQMGTFGRLKGRKALQTVLKAHGRFSQEELFQITKVVPDPASITDDLEEMSKESDDAADATTIRWVLENEPDALREYVYLDEDEQLQGDLAGDFGQAMRLEGCVTNMGKHAGGIIISPVPVRSVVPLVYDKSSGQCIAGWDMNECDKAGLTKFDVLAVAVLSRLHVFQQIVRTGTYQMLAQS